MIYKTRSSTRIKTRCTRTIEQELDIQRQGLDPQGRGQGLDLQGQGKGLDTGTINDKDHTYNDKDRDKD